MLLRELRRLLASLLMGAVHRLTPCRDIETHSAIYHVAKAMKRAQG